jgi:hypothetical protein
MTKKVFAIDTQAGIQRDGTLTDRIYYEDGRWCRFQRGRPRKILGYREITGTLAGPSRGIYLDPNDGFNNIFSGYNNGVQVVPINNLGIGSGIQDFTLTGFTPNNNNLWQFDSEFDSGGTNQQTLLAHPGQNLAQIDSTTETPVLGGDINGTTLAPIGVFTATGSMSSGTPTVVTLSAINALVGVGQVVTKVSGSVTIPANTTVISVVGTTVTLSAAATLTGTQSVTLQFDNQISVSGGVVVLHPYTFVYGNNGLIKNCAAGNLNDWVSADSNETNVASTKSVKGLPVRGGSNAPSGLFWALDSLIRVSYTPTTVTAGGTATTFYWRYDVISSQTSILSSSSVIEYDGIYYWCGVDRFMLYNGVVKEIPNTFNQNYFFDNLNYAQRQKVYANKVPRYGEIWWFYPRGNSTECNDAIIYNIRENCWYDVGEALGARRSAGYFSQVFPYPINVGWEINATGGVDSFSIVNQGSGYTNGTYPYQVISNAAGEVSAYATITVSGGKVTNVKFTTHGYNYEVGNILTAPGLTPGSGFQMIVTTTMSYVSLFQHETGTDAIYAGPGGGVQTAIQSYFETSNLGWVSGGPAQQAPVGDNYWLRLERVEPDFVMTGDMSLVVTGRSYAQGEDYDSDPYTFNQNTSKIDMREQRREMRLKFESNTIGGNYQLGYVLLNADVGDVRGYS